MISRDVIVDEIKEQQQPITSYVKAVIGHNFENFDSTNMGSAETSVVEAQIEENVRRSTRKIGFPQIL